MKVQSIKGKKLGLQEISVHMGVFDFSVTCAVGDYKKINEYISWKFDDNNFNVESWDKGYLARGKCFFKTGYVPIIWIPRKPRTSREHATLAHECIHAVFHLFDWASIPISRDTEEVFAHSTAHLITTILNFLK